MVASSPEDMIRDHLSAPRTVVTSAPVPGATGWRSATGSGGCDARPETIRFVKVRAIPGGRVYAVTFTTRAGRSMSYFCCARQASTGDWHFVGGAGGAAGGSPRRDHPWVNLGGGGGSGLFYAGGPVLDDGQTVARVRLYAANGVELEDTVDQGFVLFLTDAAVQSPSQVELLDAAGTIVSRHAAMS
jgi:hypothetical protein